MLKQSKKTPSSVEIRKLWSNESNAISMYIVTRKPSNLFNLVISIISDINLPPSTICLFLTYVVCCVEIKSGRTF